MEKRERRALGRKRDLDRSNIERVNQAVWRTWTRERESWRERERREVMGEEKKRVTEANGVRIKVVNFKILWTWLELGQTSGGVSGNYSK